jgi:hypothetical protein
LNPTKNEADKNVLILEKTTVPKIVAALALCAGAGKGVHHRIHGGARRSLGTYWGSMERVGSAGFRAIRE